MNITHQVQIVANTLVKRHKLSYPFLSRSRSTKNLNLFKINNHNLHHIKKEFQRKEEVYILSDVSSDIRGVVRHCNAYLFYFTHGKSGLGKMVSKFRVVS